MKDIVFAFKGNSRIFVKKIMDTADLSIAAVLYQEPTIALSDFNTRQLALVNQDCLDGRYDIERTREAPKCLRTTRRIGINANRPITIENASDIVIDKGRWHKTRKYAGFVLYPPEAMGSKGFYHVLGTNAEHISRLTIPLTQIYFIDWLFPMNCVSELINYLLISKEELDNISPVERCDITIGCQKPQKVCLGFAVYRIKKSFIITISSFVSARHIVGFTYAVEGGDGNVIIAHQVSRPAPLLIEITKFLLLLDSEGTIYKAFYPVTHFNYNYTINLLRGAILN